jgi:hypothetical protein
VANWIPEWLRRVCQNRDRFDSAAFLMGDDLGQPTEGILFLYGLQNPVETMFLPLRRVSAPPPGVQGAQTWQQAALLCQDRWLWEFEYTLGNYVKGEQLPFEGDGEDIWVLFNVLLVGKQRAVCDGPALAWDRVARTLPEKQQPEGQGEQAPKKKKKQVQEELARHPWLAGFLAAEQASKRPRGSESSSFGAPAAAAASSSALEEEPLVPEAALPLVAEGGLSDEALAQAYDALLLKRAEWSEEGASFGGNDFYTQLRGDASRRRRLAWPTTASWAPRAKASQRAGPRSTAWAR